ncbi:hypothetical protein [Aquamicrobium terrae]|uniref:Uncharacterized protein n=1 Tax=Aquamicrobium terrae TaxID=1324945 RepID=A0ABV2N697_9HYPH
MTQHRIHFSELLDVGRPDNVGRAFAIYKALMAENAGEDPPAETFQLSVSPEYGATRLWLYDAGGGDPQLVITFVTRCARALGLTGAWSMQWAGVASRPVVDGFSGGAHILDLASGQTIAWMSTGRWLADLSPAGGAR